MATLRDATLAIERGVNDHLGDTITYTMASGPVLTFSAWVDFDTEILNPGNSSAATDSISVELPIATVPNPVAADRITIALLPGKVWAFTKRLRGPTGGTWVLPLKRAEP